MMQAETQSQVAVCLPLEHSHMRVSQKNFQSSLVLNFYVTDSGTAEQTESSIKAAHCL
jgi:hypothetical protein